MRGLRTAGIIAAGLAAVLIVLFGVLAIIYSPTYVYRYVFWNVSTVKDYTLFPSHEVHNASPAFTFPAGTREDGIAEAVASCEFRSGGKTHTIGDLDAFLAGTDTTAFIVIRDDTIVYEKYFNGYERGSINTSFSTAKSVTSALVGIAVDEGLIGSVDDSIVAYLPELRGRGMDGITVRHLLMMCSGLRYVEGDFPWADDPVDYYHPNLRLLALGKAIVSEPPGLHFHYSNYHPQYLGIILERVTGMSPSEYLQERIWKQIGMEFEASWSTDSEESGFERMGSSINARAIDFARLGRLFLNNGRWGDRQVISERWVTESTSPEAPETSDYYTGIKSWSNEFFAEEGAYYKYMWWGYRNADGTYDYFAWGKLGQIIYVCPSRKVVIVRNGLSDGGIYSWGAVCRTIARRM